MSELFGADIDGLLLYCSDYIKKDSAYVKPFSKKRAHYCSLVTKTRECLRQPFTVDLEKRKQVAEQIYEQGKWMDQKQFYYLIDSVVHMTMNRHFPFNRKEEERTQQYARFAYMNLAYRLKEQKQYENQTV